MSSSILGTSPDVFNNTFLHLVRCLRPSYIIEFGIGQGKLGNLLLQSNLLPQDGLIGVQPLSSPSELSLLKSRGYNSVLDTTITRYLDEHIDLQADMFIAADVFEHLPFSEMVSALDQLLYRCNLFLLIHPSKHPQKAKGNTFNAHRTSFELLDLCSRFEVIYYNLTGFAQISSIHRYHFTLLRGHMNLKTYPPLL